MEFILIVDERSETREKGLTVTLRLDDEKQRFSSWWLLNGTAHPDVRQLKIGDRLRVTVEPAPVASDVELTIEGAERRPVHA